MASAALATLPKASLRAWRAAEQALGQGYTRRSARSQRFGVRPNTGHLLMSETRLREATPPPPQKRCFEALPGPAPN
eukprot:13778955-Alexandrium_andersonii.AAC.1